MNRGSLRFRLVLAGGMSILAALMVSALGLPLLFERHVERRVEGELGVLLTQIIAGIARDTDGALILSETPADPRFIQPLSGLYWQIQTGDAVLRSRSLWDAELVLPAKAHSDGAVRQLRVMGPGGSELIASERSVTLSARLGGGQMRAIVALDAAELVVATRAFAADLFPYLAVIAIVLIGAGYAQVIVGLRPLGTVRERLATIRQGTTFRLGDAFPNEIRPLAAEVDALLDARDGELERARSRAGDLAHGLKTPLQVLSGDIQRLREKGEGAIATEIEKIAATMRRHVDRELARARSKAGASDARASVAEVVDRVVSVIHRTPNGGALDWTINIPATLVVCIDVDDLAEAIGNLVENAARHASRKVSIRTYREGEFVVISVVDDGPGIPEGQIEEAQARGHQLDRQDSGAGLGLAIVRDIASGWGGRFEIRNSPAGFEANLAVRSGAAGDRPTSP